MINKFPGKCDRCGVIVAATTGTLHRVNDRWIARHGTCTTRTPAGRTSYEQAWDTGINEGGDGYNPYRDEREEAELAAAKDLYGCSRCRKTPTRRSQLWEACDHCSHEPIYV